MSTAKRSPKRTAKKKRAKSTDIPPEVLAEMEHQVDAYIGEWSGKIRKHLREQDRAMIAKRAKPKSR
jgi:hypothetical protein